MPPFCNAVIRLFVVCDLAIKTVVDAWRGEYNNYRPHSSPGYLAPLEFAAAKMAAPRTRGVLTCEMLSGTSPYDIVFAPRRQVLLE